jgi:ABC-type sugar transport system substrate-binding protein
MDIAQLRDTVTTLLAASPNLVGVFTLPDASIIPAIYVVGRQGVPTEFKVSGLEVTIEEFPRLNPRAGVGTFQQRKEWTLVLVDYDTNSKKLNEAAQRLSSRFPDARFSFMPESDVVYGQYRVVIPDLEIGRIAR